MAIDKSNKNLRQNIVLWINFARLKTLVASVAPVALSAALVFQHNRTLDLWALVLVLVLSVTMQVACNYTNDYYDYRRGSDGKDRLGPMRALQSGKLSAHAVGRAIVFINTAIFAMAVLVGVAYGPFFSFIVVLSALAGFCYTGGAYPLAYHGLGDIFAFLFFGPVVVFSSVAIFNNGVWLMTMPVVAVAVACGLFSLGLITVNNLRDVDSDRKNQKNTLAVLWGRGYAIWQFRIAVLLLTIFPLSAAFQHGSWLMALPAIAMLVLLFEAWRLPFSDGARLNRVLAKTGGVYAFYSAIWCVAFILA